MAEVRWTPQAADDLDAAAEYVARDSPHYASLFVERILDAIDRLEQFPLRGRIVPEKQDPAVRELLVGSYRIVYRHQRDIVEVLTIHHGARLLDLS